MYILTEQRLAPAHAEALFVIDIGLDDTRLDRHLPNRHIQLRHQLPQLGQSIIGLVRHQGVGALIHAQAPTPGENAVVGQGGLQHLDKLGGLGVVNGQ
ncbi:hypothetical protein D3C76_572070 [compost metagenome]